MLLDGLVIGLIIGFLRKGSLMGLADISLKQLWVLAIAVILQMVPSILQSRFSGLETYAAVATMISYVGIVYFCWLNMKNSGFGWMAAGAVCNFLVMVVNGGKMPVYIGQVAHISPGLLASLKEGTQGKHILMGSSTHLNFLGDIIYLQRPYPHPGLFSIGDILLCIGMMAYIQSLMVRRQVKKMQEAEI